MQTGIFIMMGLQGAALTFEEKKLIEKEDIGGVILFKRNIESYQSLKQLCQNLRRLKTSSPLIIAIDREGGVVDRLNHIRQLTSWPNLSTLKNLSSKEIEETSQLLHLELRHLGINMNLAPCLDILHPQSHVLKGRAFSVNPLFVAYMARFFLQGAKRAGVLSCIKHFPGHGGVAEDSHHTRPIDLQPRGRMDQAILPFRQAMACQAPSLMLSHILYPALDSVNVAPCSAPIVSHWLREELKFSGLILTDDMDMNAVAGEPHFAQRALSVGVHNFICGQSRSPVYEIIESLEKAPHLKNIISLRKKEILSFKKKHLRELTAPPVLLPQLEDRLWWLQKLSKKT